MSSTPKDGQLADLHHGFFDGGHGLLDVRHQLGIIEDAAWNLAMATAQAQDQVQGGLLEASYPLKI